MPVCMQSSMQIPWLVHHRFSADTKERDGSEAGGPQSPSYIATTANMQLGALVTFGIIFPQMFSLSTSPPPPPPLPPPDCSATVRTCMSDLCKKEQALHRGVCYDEACQIKGSPVCNMTIQAVLDQYPPLQGCVCVWEEELCDSVQALSTQCSLLTAQQKRSTADWQSSSLTHYVSDDSGSCLDRMKVCVSDEVCNRYLVPVLQVCSEEECDSDSCHQVTQQFYSSMPLSVAEMLVLCECEASDQSCLHMKTALHSSTCGGSPWICQETVNQCAEDETCRKLFKTFREKCWSSGGRQCTDTDLQYDECFTRMDPALILGADPECIRSFLATLGTVLHYPCTCKGILNKDLPTCNMIHDVFHNRSHFRKSWNKSSNSPSKPPEMNESGDDEMWSNDHLLYIFATLLLVGVIILLPLAISKVWILRRKDRTKFHHPQKRSFVVIH
ncbi:GDNF family receptor alpha-like [Xyrichtys novacula]|uniref:GDNF family receptor alpha-like n=1 Tax=Xyrichtys novacula TaxID=13765 RepID=A0AAV1G2P7_XYRNO|nr:GDNF family receptor alpha-like [Xyrichtys novacula]